MIDLHLHSSASDGTFSPQEIVRFAAKLGFSAIAVTDHDSVEGVGPALNEGLNFPDLEIVPAVELSSDVDGRDVHFLGYFIDFESSWLNGHLLDLREARMSRAERMVKNLTELGLELDFRDVLALAGDGAVGRGHVARALEKAGQTRTVKEAFEKYIGRDSAAYVEKYMYTPKDVINVIKKSGGVPVMAHPGLVGDDDLIEESIAYGLAGIEVVHSEHRPDQIDHYLKLAKDLGLVATGGSDCHGLDSGRGLMLGSVRVPDSVLIDLREVLESA